MKKLVFCVLISAGTLLTSNVYSATYPGQACEKKFGGELYRTSTYAQNTSSSTINITCPFDRLKDGGTGSATAVVYFVNEGKNKTCYFDNFNIDTGGLGKWTSTSGVRRLVLPKINPTIRWSPFVINCSLPPNSKITGYYLAE